MVVWLIACKGKLGADRTDLGFAGTYREAWDFHTETSCMLEAAMDREGKSLLLGHLICSWAPGWASICILGSWLHLRMTSCVLNPLTPVMATWTRASLVSVVFLDEGEGSKPAAGCACVVS